ncbi:MULTISPECIES: acetoacetate--CoA ligase [unclassified Microbacterium]|uniref:acetoacetate--CoA ligase n=1 Tax=unclassified Microbacterium TaxID=2609290 RepID=UPI000EAA7D4F|nr:MULTISPECIES: acetoacetate--CoA ligase [unclassified Microbacterium]MBT2486522.1 acetoacetate--CoA ligase [Microbacterium sp. ISL-108]RKN69215.1 acetoacetate--CoA ligase [Microbacterium sp. CGR2]
MIVDPAASHGEIIWRPDASAAGETQERRFAEFARARGADVGEDYAALWRWSVDDADAFWSSVVDFAGVDLGGEPGAVRIGGTMPGVRWFPGRTLNFAQHLLDGRDGTALLAVAEDGATEEVSFADLRGRVGALATHLRALGIGQGDRVVAVLPNVPAAVVGLLATASIGAVWSVCSPEFGPGAIVSRFRQLEPKALIASPGYRLAGADRDRRRELAQVIEQLPTLEQVLWVTGHADVPPPATALIARNWDDIVSTPQHPEFVDVEFSHPLWVLFSSGTTGIPKGIVHGHGGALLEQLQMLMFGGDVRPGDRFLAVASTSWVVWNSLVSVIGLGAVAVLLDGNPAYPTVDRVWELAAQTRATVLGVGAGFVHACVKAALDPARDHDLSSLREVQVTGSPLSADGFRWIYGHVGDVWLVSMSGGTDIAGCFVGGASTEPVRVGYIQAPALGVCIESWDESGHVTAGKGELVVTQPIPSMPLYFWGDDHRDRYRASYFDTYPGVWRHGDFIEISDRGIRILGRSDSTLNRNGIRLGPADIYAVVEALPEVGEAMVIGAEIGDDQYFMPLFVRIADGVDESEAKTAIITAIRAHLSARYLPDEIVVMRGIPHTRTGKKLEVPIKRLFQGARLSDVVDLGSVDDPELMAEYAEFADARDVGVPRR